jgi:hypothetical protein
MSYLREHTGAVNSSFPLSRSPIPYRVTWTEETFIKSDDAEAALCGDRSAFVLRNDIMVLIPSRIKKHMIHSDSMAHIHGFEELFVYLNQRPNRLRQLVVAYFNDCPPLRGHLSQSSQVFFNDTNIKIVDISPCRAVRCRSIPEPQRRRS